MPSAARIEARRTAGLCLACGTSEPEEGRSKCTSCLERAREAAAARRELAAAKGMCEACMRRKRKPGRGNRCNVCADKYLVKQLERARARRAAAKRKAADDEHRSATSASELGAPAKRAR